jgi:hypothetical protein
MRMVKKIPIRQVKWHAVLTRISHRSIAQERIGIGGFPQTPAALLRQKPHGTFSGAVIVSNGLTPREPGIIAPSQT